MISLEASHQLGSLRSLRFAGPRACVVGGNFGNFRAAAHPHSTVNRVNFPREQILFPAPGHE